MSQALATEESVPLLILAQRLSAVKLPLAVVHWLKRNPNLNGLNLDKSKPEMLVDALAKSNLFIYSMNI